MYKAKVYLTQELVMDDLKGKVCLETVPNHDKDHTLKLVRTMHERGVIDAYRLLTSPNEGVSWYYASEVVMHIEQQPIFS